LIDQVRNNAVVSHNGAGFVGFRLLVDRENGRALDVSYWDDATGAQADRPGLVRPSPGDVETRVVRTNVYELAIDAV
jgi:hypothetical protein